MDKIDLYRQHIQELMIERAKLRAPSDPVKTETFFDSVTGTAARAFMAV